MEKENAQSSAGFFAYERGISPMWIVAGLFALTLVGVVVSKLTANVSASGLGAASPALSQQNSLLATPTSDPLLSADASSSDATSSDPLSSLGNNVMASLEGAYVQMQESGTYSSTTAVQVGESLAPYVTASVSYPTFSASDIKTDPDTSYQRMLQYRSDLRASLAPLLNNTEPEYEIYAYYIDTQDASYLTKLQNVAADYRAAASSTAQVVVPADAVTYQIGILDAMEEFAATLDSMVAHAQDPFASTALLSSYVQAQNDMVAAFNSLADYYKSKSP